MTSHDTAIEAACRATILGEDADGKPVHLEMREAEAAISAYLKEMGTEAVGYQWRDRSKRSDGEWRDWSPWKGGDLEPVSLETYQSERRPIFAAPSEDIEKLEAERDELRAGIKRLSDEEELCAETTGDDPFSMVYLAAKLARVEVERDEWKSEYFRRHKDAADNMERALAAEAERDAKAALIEEARRVLEPFAKAFDELREWSDLGEMTTHDDLSAAKSFLARLETPMQPSEITEAMRLAFYEKAEVQKTGSIRHLDEALAAAITAALSVEQEPAGWVHSDFDIELSCYDQAVLYPNDRSTPSFKCIPVYVYPPTPVSSPARDEEIERLKECPTCNGTGKEGRHSICRDCDDSSSLSDRSVSGDAVMVKPLEWDDRSDDNSRNSYAKTPIGRYEAFEFRMNGLKSGPKTIFGWNGPWTNADQMTDNFDAAKAAAQADYESRVSSALVTADRTEAGRDEAFTREQVEAHVNKRLEEFAIAQQSVSASKDELIRELVRELSRIADDYHPAYDDDAPLALSEMREAVSGLVTLASEAGINDGGEK